MKILIDLRFLDYGSWGGIENVAYYLIESLKNKDVEIILDVRASSRRIFRQKYITSKNIKIISDPIEGIYHYFRGKIRIVSGLLRRLDGIVYQFLGIELFRPRKKWANSIKADVVIYPNHLVEVQHERIPVISFMHAILPDYEEKHFKKIESHVQKSSALISLWRYPFQEFIKRYPTREKSWHWVPCMLTVNLHTDLKEQLIGIDSKYWLYVTFFVDRKNHLSLVKAYKLALDKNPNLPMLVFVGKGEQNYFNKVNDLVRELNLENRVKIYFEFMPENKVAYLYEHAAAIVAPTLWEAASGTVVEACIAGKPVACSDVPPLKDFAQSFDLKMLFFDPLNPKDIAEKLLQLNTNYEEISLWAKQNANKLKKYDKDYFGEKIIQIINSVLVK